MIIILYFSSELEKILMINKIKITDEMRKHALIESKKRDSFIKHHFEVSHLSYDLR